MKNKLFAICLLTFAWNLLTAAPPTTLSRPDPRRKEIIQKYSTNEPIVAIKQETDPAVQVLYSLKEILLIDKVFAELASATPLNIAFVGRNGRVYQGEPSANDDAIDRATYEKMVEERVKNFDDMGKLNSIKQELLELMRVSIKKFEGPQRKAASELLESLVNP